MNLKRKKLFLILSLALVGVLFLVGCSNNDVNDFYEGSSTLTVAVVDEADQSISADISILQDGEVVKSKTAESAEIDLDNGEYTLMVEKDGYVTHKNDNLTLTEDLTEKITLEKPENLLGNESLSNNFYLKEDVTENGEGNFDTQDNWLYLQNGGTSSASLEDEMFKVDIEDGGSNSYSVQLLQAPITIEEGYKYRVEFDAKSSEERNLEVKIGGTADRGYAAYNSGDGETGGYLADLTTEMKSYDFEFVMGEETDDLARFEFQLGADTGEIWLDNIRLYKLGEADESEMPEDEKAEWVYDKDFFFIFNVAVGGNLGGEVDTTFPKEMKVDYIKVYDQDGDLDWEDDFDGNSIDSNNWSFEVGNGHEQGIPGWGNDELQYYTDGKNARVEDSNLIITAKEEEISDEHGEYNYTSTRMITQDKVNMKYGKVEIRAQLPEGQGLWPAFWMLGSDIAENPWPACGEIDIMEFIAGQTDEVHGTVHGPNHSGGGGITQDYQLEEGNFVDSYHTFTLEWTPDKISWFIDDEEEPYHVVERTADNETVRGDTGQNDEPVEEPEVDVATGDTDSDFYFIADDSSMVDITIDTDDQEYNGSIRPDTWGTGTQINSEASYNGKNAWEMTAGNNWGINNALLSLMPGIYDGDKLADFPADLTTYDSLEITLAFDGNFTDLMLQIPGEEVAEESISSYVDLDSTEWQSISIPLSEFEAGTINAEQIGIWAAEADSENAKLYITDYYLKAN